MNKYFFLFLILFSVNRSSAQLNSVTTQNIALPGFFSSNMVLQRDKPIKFWGTASPGSSFIIAFAEKKKTVKADDKGRWIVIFPALIAGSGYELKVIGTNSFSYKNILIGDVWLASGQSNMDFTFGNTDSVAYDNRVNNNIRYLTTPTSYSNYPQTDFRKLEWQICTKENAPSFSAVAYYFAQKINKETGVPIGIINTSWGGTSIKAWISENGIARIPEYKVLLDTFLSKRNSQVAIDSILVRNYAIIANNNNKILKADKGYIQQWQNGKKGSENWSPIELPGTLQAGNLKNFAGVIWFRREIVLPADVKDELCYIQYGRILGNSDLYINGAKIGSNSYNKSENKFFIKTNTLLPGKNIFVIRLVVSDTAVTFQANPNEMVVRFSNENHPTQFSIAGQWEYHTTLTGIDIAGLTGKLEIVPPNTTVSSIYNSKINPLIPLAIKGILWYQGENDVAVAYFYRTLFKNMIIDWRQQFKQGDLPFIFAQLPSFGKVKNDPNENSEWAEIRESQADVLSLPNTAMAAILELGNPGNIHPHNKKPVGDRMAQAALKMDYHFKDAPQSPMLKSFEIKGNEVHLYFKNTGSGLSAKNKEVLKYFAIAGSDKKFVWGNATIVNANEVIVSYPTIQQPVSVRYAWAYSPMEANLINKEGLSAAPFRTDNWTLTTQGKVDNK